MFVGVSPFWRQPVGLTVFHPDQADAETIQKAFRKLAKSFHPDKFSDPEDHARAQARFIELREASEILLDANKRQIYDMYGVKGLSKQNWEVGAHLKTPEEVRQR